MKNLKSWKSHHLDKYMKAQKAGRMAQAKLKDMEDAEKFSDEDKKKMFNDLQTDFKDFQKIQDSILSGMKEIDPLLTKAETFIEKFEHYGKKLEKSA